MDEDWHKYRLQGEQAAQGGNYPQAEAMWAMAALIAQSFAAKDPRFAFSLDNLGQVLARQGKFSLAENILGRSWQTKTQHSVSQVEAARTLNIVSELYFYMKRFEESEQLITRVFTVYQTIYGRDHSHTQEVARNLVMIQQARALAGPTASSAYHQALPAAGEAAPPTVNPPTGTYIPSMQGQPPTASYRELPAIQHPTTAGYAAQPIIPAPAAPPKPPAIAMSRRSSSLKQKCEVCGFEIEGEWCGRCTGTSLKAISPENRLK